MQTIPILKAELEAQLDDATREWFQKSCAHSIADHDENTLFAYSAEARRYCGDQPFVHSDQAAQYAYLVGSLTDIARIVLLGVSISTLSTDACHNLLKNYYRCGDELEKAALLKAISLLDPTGSALQTAINACRVNSLVIFNAIALHNPYASNFFPELNWNQLVLKTLFQGQDINNIIGLSVRQTPTLSAMCMDYAEERLLADREPPASIWLAMNLNDLDKNAVQLFTRFLTHDDPLHRFYVATALSRQAIHCALSC